MLRLLDWQNEFPDPLTVTMETGSQFMLDGLLIARRGVSITGPPCDDPTQARASICGAEVVIRHCTLVPGWGLRHECEPSLPADPASCSPTYAPRCASSTRSSARSRSTSSMVVQHVLDTTPESPPNDATVAANVLRVRPQFTSRRYGLLAQTCAEEIKRGADDESEMGVFHDLFEPQRADGHEAGAPPRWVADQGGDADPRHRCRFGRCVTAKAASTGGHSTTSSMATRHRCGPLPAAASSMTGPIPQSAVWSPAAGSMTTHAPHRSTAPVHSKPAHDP